MKYIILILCVVGISVVLLNEESMAAPTDNLYMCLDHGEYYTQIRGHNVSCPSPPVQTPPVTHKEHRAGDPDCIVKIPAM